MKKIYTLLCIAATMLAACAKENIAESGEATPQDEEVKYIDVTFGAEFPVLTENSKTMLNSDDLSVSWSEGDEIAVNNNNGIGTATLDLTIFTSKINPTDPHKATFSGTIREGATKFFAVYPSANVELGSTADAGVIADGNIYMFLPNEQTATEGSFTNGCALSYAYGTANKGVVQNTVEFHNLCALLEFTLPDYVTGAQSVNIKSNDGKEVSGGCVLNREGYTFNSFKASSHKKPTFDNVTVTAPNTTDKFYAVIFPGKYPNGFTIKVTTAGGDTYSRSWGNDIAEIKAGCVYHIGGIGAVLDEQKVDLAVNIEQNIKTGSIATFNIAATGDFKTMVKSWSINLYNSDNQLVRKIEGNTTGSGTLDIVGDYKLLAAGDDYYATVTYFMQTGKEREAIKIEGIKAPQFTVEGVVINATPTLNYDGGTLNGTDVQLSFDTIAVDPDLAKLINWTDITLTDENRVTYRTATAAGKMTPAAGKPYLPNGDYTLTAYFTLPELGSYTPTALDPKTITVNLTPTFGVELTSAKTSYDYYKAGDINTANGCNNMGIYKLAANVTGISSAVATQMAGKFSYEWFLDGNSTGKTENTDAAVSGISQNTNAAVKVAFGNKNVNCKAMFDGSNATSGNIAVDITGLPYSYSFPGDLNKIDEEGWKRTGNTIIASKAFSIIDGKNNGGVKHYFYTPADIKVTADFNVKYYNSSALKKIASYVDAVNENASSTSSNKDEQNVNITTGPSSGAFDRNQAILTLTSSTPYVFIYGTRVSGDVYNHKLYVNSCLIKYKQ